MTGIKLISWADDRTSVTFKDIRLNLNAFRGFLRSQIALLADDLRELCFLKPEEHSQLLTFDLAILTDNPASKQPMWFFITANGLQKHAQWLLKRVLQHESLQARFLAPRSRKAVSMGSRRGPQWQVAAAKQYLKQTRTFLVRLTMLVQILSGQPARDRSCSACGIRIPPLVGLGTCMWSMVW